MLNQELKSFCFALEEDARALVSDNDNKKQLLEQQAKAMEELNQKWRKTRDALRAEKMRIQDLGKTKEQVREDFWNTNLYRHLFDDLPDKLRDDLGEYEDAWLEGDYHYDCKVFYVLPGDTGARFTEPAVEIVLEFNDHEYLAQGDEIARLAFTPEAFRPELIPMLVDKVIAVFQDQ